nr:MAG TPA: ERF superfamily protein [Caudoviricetes sp.]
MKHSDELKNLAKALAKFQADIKDPARDKDNPYFKSKYVALDGLLDAVRPVLAANGLSFIQSPVSNGQDMGVATLLMHDSGEWIESDPFMLHAVKNDPQAGGSAITYARRYSLSAVLGVAWDDDDDANMATKGHQSRSNARNDSPPKGNCTKTGRQTKKTASSSSQMQKKPTSVDDYYQLVIDWARANEAVMFIGPLLKEKFNKGHFKELSLAEAKAFYENVGKLVDAAKAKDDAALMEGV